MFLLLILIFIFWNNPMLFRLKEQNVWYIMKMIHMNFISNILIMIIFPYPKIITCFTITDLFICICCVWSLSVNLTLLVCCMIMSGFLIRLLWKWPIGKIMTSIILLGILLQVFFPGTKPEIQEFHGYMAVCE